ncbi:MAG: universal stress protein [Acidobacteria bacterium]|nr:universal stress protein [Acidobacteriota bacterium]
MAELEPAVVVGIADHQADAVLLVGAAIATQFGARIVCVTVDPERFAETDGRGTVNRWPIDPDAIDDPDALEAAERALRDHLATVLEPLGNRWELRLAFGDPADGLSRVAAEVSALMIVIGTSPRSVLRSTRELFTGSIAAHLAHRQPRPVLVVPLNPVLSDGALPWSGNA